MYEEYRQRRPPRSNGYLHRDHDVDNKKGARLSIDLSWEPQPEVTSNTTKKATTMTMTPMTTYSNDDSRQACGKVRRNRIVCESER
jgi:hypothetical protein